MHLRINNMTTKKLQVLLADATEDNTNPNLPVQYKRKLHSTAAGGEFRKLVANGGTAQHIYLVSKEEIKAGCYYINMELITHASVENTVHRAMVTYTPSRLDVRFRIEASTDPSLDLPDIPKDFVDKFVGLNGNPREVIVKWSEEYNNAFVNTNHLATEVVIVDKEELAEKPQQPINVIVTYTYTEKAAGGSQDFHFSVKDYDSFVFIHKMQEQAINSNQAIASYTFSTAPEHNVLLIQWLVKLSSEYYTGTLR